jgi:hypothetical protein
MPEMTLKPYMVTLSFAEGGPLFLNALLAPTPEAATAMLATIVMREHTVTQPLMGCMAMELTPEFLRAALRAVEGKLPPDGNAQVISLVPAVTQTILDDPHAPLPEQQAYPGPQDDPPPAA